jgi:hypothetical protein
MLNAFSRREKRTQITSLQDETRLAKRNSYQIAAGAWPLEA